MIRRSKRKAAVLRKLDVYVRDCDVAVFYIIKHPHQRRPYLYHLYLDEDWADVTWLDIVSKPYLP